MLGTLTPEPSWLDDEGRAAMEALDNDSGPLIEFDETQMKKLALALQRKVPYPATHVAKPSQTARVATLGLDQPEDAHQASRRSA